MINKAGSPDTGSLCSKYVMNVVTGQRSFDGDQILVALARLRVLEDLIKSEINFSICSVHVCCF